MVEMVPAVLKHRLRPGGRALLCCAVREQVRYLKQAPALGQKAPPGPAAVSAWHPPAVVPPASHMLASHTAPKPSRMQAMFDGLAVALAALGMRVGITPVQPQADDAGLLDIRQDYEGGYIMIAVEHADAPADDWHRPDLF